MSTDYFEFVRRARLRRVQSCNADPLRLQCLDVDAMDVYLNSVTIDDASNVDSEFIISFRS